MWLKCLEFYSGRQSYSVGKVLVRYMKSAEFIHKYKHNYLNMHCNYVSNKAMNSMISDAIDESYEKPEKIKIGKHRLSKKIFDSIYGYLSESCPEDVLELFPKMYFRRVRSQSDNLRLAHPGVADIIVDLLKPYVLNKGDIVVEAHPGVGILSKKLIDAGVDKLHLHEPSVYFFNVLKKLYGLDNDKVTLHKSDFLTLGKLAYQDKLDNGTRVQDMLSFYPKKNWHEEPSLKIVGCIDTLQFIKHLIVSLVFSGGIMSHCRPEFYLFIGPSLHLNLTSSGENGYRYYRYTTVLFQLFFDYQLLGKVPRKAFLPWPPIERKIKNDEVFSLNQEFLYFMKIVPKKNIYDIIPADKLPAFWYFIRHHYWKRSNKVIEEMESWIPGCGVRLILQDYNIFTEYGDLKPSEALDLFIQFSQWPEYKDSSFLSLLETSLRLDENSDEILDSIKKFDDLDDSEGKEETS